MRRMARLQAEEVRNLLRRKKIATMPELKEALGTAVDMSVFRKLAELSYLSSYSHRGRYYTLREIAHFDSVGLWSHRSVRFSRYGTLRATCEALVAEGEAGYFARELEGIAQVAVQEPLLGLVQAGRLWRQMLEGRYLYLAANTAQRREQLRVRGLRAARSPWGRSVLEQGELSEDLRGALALLFRLLDEKQRRLLAGMESLRLGHGGDSRVSALLGINVHTVARGRRQLLSGEVEFEATRRPGGGRKATEKKRPGSSTSST